MSKTKKCLRKIRGRNICDLTYKDLLDEIIKQKDKIKHDKKILKQLQAVFTNRYII